jgi:voltage-gated potassium channel
MRRYNNRYSTGTGFPEPVIIIGGGRVGRATARALTERGQDYRIVELQPERVRDPEKYVVGDAAELRVLEQAGIRETSTVVITTHDDDTNIYLTIYCRRLRPDIQIISRARLERNVPTLHRAGADITLSYAGMGSGTIMNLLDRSNILMVAEGLDVFRVQVPTSLVGRTIAQAAIRRKLGCTVVALRTNGDMQINPDPNVPLPAGAEMIIIGTTEAEQHFLERYGRELPDEALKREPRTMQA